MSCKFISRPEYKICAGDLSSLIVIKSRVFQTDPNGTGLASEVYTTVATVRAMILTPSGYAQFGEVSLPAKTHSHEFYIRYRTGLTVENKIEYASQYFNVLDITNLGELNKYLLLKCNISGSTSYQGSNT